MRKTDWIKIAQYIIENQIKEETINFDDISYGYKIFGDLEKQIGFMIIWEVVSHKAVHISRMKLPEGLEVISMRDDSIYYHDHVPQNLKFEPII